MDEVLEIIQERTAVWQSVRSKSQYCKTYSECSACKVPEYLGHTKRYCPNCGCKMLNYISGENATAKFINDDKTTKNKNKIKKEEKPKGDDKNDIGQTATVAKRRGRPPKKRN